MAEIVSVKIHPAIGMTRPGNSPDGIDGCGMLVVSLARRLGSENPLLAYCAAPLQPTNTPGSRGRTRPAGHSYPLYRWRTSGLTALPRRPMRLVSTALRPVGNLVEHLAPRTPPCLTQVLSVKPAARTPRGITCYSR